MAENNDAFVVATYRDYNPDAPDPKDPSAPKSADKPAAKPAEKKES